MKKTGDLVKELQQGRLSAEEFRSKLADLLGDGANNDEGRTIDLTDGQPGKLVLAEQILKRSAVPARLSSLRQSRDDERHLRSDG